MRSALLAPLALLLFALPCTPARAQSPVALFPNPQRSATPATAAPLGHGVLYAAVDPGALRSFRATAGGRVEIPLPGSGGVTLDLARFDILTSDAVVVAHGRDGVTELHPDLTLFRGGIEGDPEGWAVLSLSGDAVMGVISTRDGRFEIGPPSAPGGLHAIGAERTMSEGVRPFTCFTSSSGDPGPRATGARQAQSAGVRPNGTRLVCRVAVDCDYEYYANKFGGNLTAATNYILTVFATVALIYERDVNTALRVPMLTIWTTPDDPWTEDDIQLQLEDFAYYWQVHRAGVSRNLAFLCSGRWLGGGVAYFAGICSTIHGYGVCQVDGYYSYPTNSTTWDVSSVAHELGHNFNSSHTHSCYWQEQGYVPPGALIDSCYTAEGTCYSGPVGIVPPDRGTIMSYCHVLWPGMDNVRLDFHPACISVMRGFAQTSCLAADSLQPPRSLIATQSGSGTILGWNASPTPGIVRYDLYRSLARFDLNPAFVGSSTSTAWFDPSSGPYFYKARAVRAADSSDFSNEAVPAPCGPQPRTSYAAGTLPVAIIARDLLGSDGIPDVVFADSAGSRVGWLRGLRCGTCVSDFDIPRYAALTAPPQALASADFDHDGYPDLAASGGGALTILRDPSAGAFVAGTPYALPGTSEPAIAAADLDEDGILDLALADDDTLRILHGLGTGGVGDGTFAPGQAVGAGSAIRGLALGDFDEDGICDVALACAAGVVVLRGQGTGSRGNGSFGPPTMIAAGSAAGVVRADFDRDGILDLAAAAAGGVSVMRGLGSAGHGDGTFGAPQLFACGGAPAALAVCDLDEDGVADLVTANPSAGTLGFLRGAGDGTFDSPQSFACGDLARAVATADLDEDGRPDLMALDGTSPGAVSQLRFRCAGALATGVELTAPHGGETWITGTEQTISWRKGEGVIAVDVEVSYDRGTSWMPIARGVSDTSLAWTVCGPLTHQTRVRIADPTVPTRAAATDSSLTIIPAELLSAPAAPRSDLSLAGLRPNPARGGFAVSFTLPGPAPARLELFDLAGRRLRAIEVGGLGAGPHTVEISGESPLAPGVYMVRLSSIGRMEMARGIVLR